MQQKTLVISALMKDNITLGKYSCILFVSQIPLHHYLPHDAFELILTVI